MAPALSRRRPSQQPAAAADRRLPHRGVLTACVIAAGFGVAWALWGASGLPTSAQGAVRGIGVVAGILIIGRSVRLRRDAPSPPESMFRSPAYRRVVAVEVLAIIAGLVALGATGHSDYVAAWVAAVVGMHFLAFGRLISSFYYPLGVVVTIGGIAGAAVGAAGDGGSGVEATSGLIAAVSLLAASGYRAFRRPA